MEDWLRDAVNKEESGKENKLIDSCDEMENVRGWRQETEQGKKWMIKTDFSLKKVKKHCYEYIFY